MIQKILGYLDPKSMQQASLVNYDWYDSIIAVAYYNKMPKIKKFLNFLFLCLEENPCTAPRAALFNFISEKISLRPKNLVEIKKIINSYQETILHILKELSVDDLNSLEFVFSKISKPVFFDDIFRLVKIYQCIDHINHMTESLHTKLLREMISMELININNGSIDKAIDIVNEIFVIFNDLEPFFSVLKKLVEKGYINRTLGIIDKNLDQDKKQEAFQAVFESLMWRAGIRHALDNANDVFDKTTHWRASDSISRAIKRIKGQIGGVNQNIFRALIENRSQDIFNALAESKNQDISRALQDISNVLLDISKAWIEKNNIDKAIAVAILTPNRYIKLKAIQGIFEFLAKKNNMDEAVKFANTMPIEHVEMRDIQNDILLALISSGSPNMVFDVLHVLLKRRLGFEKLLKPV